MLFLSWDDIKHGAEDIARQVLASGYTPTFLIGVTVGGLVPLTLVAKELALQSVATVSASAYGHQENKGVRIRALPQVDLSQERVLLIDDITETGETLISISDILRSDYHVQNIRTASIVIRKDKGTFKPDYSSIESEKWVVFPWEKGVEAGIDEA